MKKVIRLIILILITSNINAYTQNSYYINKQGTIIKERIITPKNYIREKLEKNSFAEYLQNLPLKPDGSKVLYYNGSIKDKKMYMSLLLIWKLENAIYNNVLML